MKSILISILVFTTIHIAAQETYKVKSDDSENRNHWRCCSFEYSCKVHESESLYANNSKGFAYIFGNKVNVRDTTNLEGKIVAVLDIGDKVILNGWVHGIKVKEHQDYWYKIELINGIKGYIHGSLLAKNALHYDIDSDGTTELLMLGSDFTNYPWSKFKILKNNKVVMSRAFTADSLYMVDYESVLRVIKDSKLSNQAILEISTGFSSCVYHWKSLFFFWNDNKLNKIFDVSTYTYQGPMSSIVYFPSDEYGKENEIRVFSSSQEMNDEWKYEEGAAYLFHEGAFYKKIKNWK